MKKQAVYMIYKRIFSMILALVFSLTVLPVWAGTVNTAKADSITAADKFASGNGTSGSPYVIKTAGQLQLLSDKVNGNESNDSGLEYAKAYYQLDDDIDLEYKEWTPIGNSNSIRFKGNFNGNGHKIIGLSVYTKTSSAGLFGYIDIDGKVEGLGLNGYVGGSYQRRGGIAGTSYGTIERCYYLGVVDSGTAAYAGGIVGHLDGGKIINCYNTGEIKGGGNVGGITGAALNNGSTPCTITNCYNIGKITVDAFNTDSGGSIVGGGGAYMNSSYGIDIGAGGLLGTATNTNVDELSKIITRKQFEQQSTFQNWDFGTVWEMDGFLGRPVLIKPREESIRGDDPNYIITSAEELDVVRKAVNEGRSFEGKNFYLGKDIDMSDVCDDDTLGSWIPIGYGDSSEGFSGTFNGEYNGKQYKIRNLYLDDGSSDGQGLFGTVNKEGTLENLIVEGGTVNGQDYIGAIVGKNYGTVNNCVNNNCNVSGRDYIGGIAGINYGKISGSQNIGSVYGRNYIGGITGSNWLDSTNIQLQGQQQNSDGETILNPNGGTTERSFNDGDVTGTTYIGGIAGANYKLIQNCYNASNMENAGTKVGGITGNFVAENKDSAFVKNCHNYGNISSDQPNSFAAIAVFGDASAADGHVFNCYYNSNVMSVGIVDSSSSSKEDEKGIVEGKSAPVFATGEVTYLLVHGPEAEEIMEAAEITTDDVWFQKLPDEDIQNGTSDQMPYPILIGDYDTTVDKFPYTYTDNEGVEHTKYVNPTTKSISIPEGSWVQVDENVEDTQVTFVTSGRIDREGTITFPGGGKAEIVGNELTIPNNGEIKLQKSGSKFPGTFHVNNGTHVTGTQRDTRETENVIEVDDTAPDDGNYFFLTTGRLGGDSDGEDDENGSGDNGNGSGNGGDNDPNGGNGGNGSGTGNGDVSGNGSGNGSGSGSGNGSGNGGNGSGNGSGNGDNGSGNDGNDNNGHCCDCEDCICNINTRDISNMGTAVHGTTMTDDEVSIDDEGTPLSDSSSENIICGCSCNTCPHNGRNANGAGDAFSGDPNDNPYTTGDFATLVAITALAGAAFTVTKKKKTKK